MPYYAVIGFDPPPHDMAARDRHRREHHDYVIGNDDMIRMAGAMLDGHGNHCGSLYLFEAENEAQVASWVASEPFCSNAIYRELKIIRIGLALNKLPLIDWRSPDADA
jgi:uncharacterized protein YciI